MRAVTAIKSAAAFTQIRREKALFAILFFIAATVIIAPLAVIDTPLLADYPNHVARMHIIGNVNREPFLEDRYIIRFDLLPNIAMDLLVPWLALVMPLGVAGRLFLALCVLTPVASVAWLHRTLFNQRSIYSLIAAFFAYHGSLIAGMVNFSLGIGLVPAALAVWIRIRHASVSRRLLVGGMMALVLYFCHLVAIAAYGLLIVGFEFARARDKWSRRDGPGRAAVDFTIAGATGLLPFCLFLRLLWSGDGAATSTLVFGNLAWKLKALLAPLANYHLPLDLAALAVMLGLAALAWRAGWIEIERRMAPGLVLLGIAFLLAPKAFWTGGVFDQRFAILLALMFVACTRYKAPEGVLSRLLPAVLVLLFLARIGTLTAVWLDHRADLAEMRRATAMVAPGARILVARPDVKTGLRLAPSRHRVFHHAAQLQSLPTLAVIEKSAMVSTLYAVAGQQPLTLKPPFDRLSGRGHVDLPTLPELALALRSGKGGPPARDQIRDWPLDFDYVVLIYGYGPGAGDLIGDLPLEPLLDGEILDLFRIVKE